MVQVNFEQNFAISLVEPISSHYVKDQITTSHYLTMVIWVEKNYVTILKRTIVNEQNFFELIKLMTTVIIFDKNELVVIKNISISLN